METVLMPGSKNENRLSAAYPPSTGNLFGLGVRLAFFFSLHVAGQNTSVVTVGAYKLSTFTKNTRWDAQATIKKQCEKRLLLYFYLFPRPTRGELLTG
jgi:hypothetical protein